MLLEIQHFSLSNGGESKMLCNRLSPFNPESFQPKNKFSQDCLFFRAVTWLYGT
ncbi:hypothetical protein SAMN05518855_102283, partial [Paenibacillus sp. CF384]